PVITGDPRRSRCPDDGSVGEGPEEAVVAAAAAGNVGREAEEGAGLEVPRMETTVEVGATQGRRDDTATSLRPPTSPPATSVPDPTPHVNPHLGRAALLQHTLH
ncbi:hypothetical protein Vafri_126, partial [Volvox africanus]